MATIIKARLLKIMDDTNKQELSNPKVRDRLRALARSYFEETLEKLNEDLILYEDAPDWDVDSMIEGTAEFLRQQQSNLKSLRFPRHITLDSITALETNFSGVSKDLEILDYFKKLLMRAEIEAQRIQLAKLEGDYSAVNPKDELFEGISPDIIRPMPTFAANGWELVYPKREVSVSQRTLQAALEAFLSFKLAKKKDAKTIDDTDPLIKFTEYLHRATPNFL